MQLQEEGSNIQQEDISKIAYLPSQNDNPERQGTENYRNRDQQEQRSNHDGGSYSQAVGGGAQQVQEQLQDQGDNGRAQKRPLTSTPTKRGPDHKKYLNNDFRGWPRR